MKTTLVTAAIAACLTVSLPRTAVGANPASANASTFRMAVLDVSYVFKQHARFNATMESMKGQMKAIEQELKGEMEKIKQKEGLRDDFELGTNDWKRLDNELTQMKADFTVQRTQRQKDFIEKEAQAYFQTYLEVHEAVKYYAERNGIGIVLRFNGEKADSKRREQILKWINKPVIYQSQIDITPDIIALLNNQRTPSSPPDARGAATPARPPIRRK